MKFIDTSYVNSISYVILTLESNLKTLGGFLMRNLVAGTGKYLPKNFVQNKEMVRIMKRHGRTHTPGGKLITPAMIESLVGVKERRWSSDKENTSDLARLAGQEALDNANITWQDLNVIRVGSSSPERFFPSTACLTLNKADGPPIEANDILAACTSGLYALVDVDRALKTEPDYLSGLAIGAETLATRMVNLGDLNANLWGDGAGAVVIKKPEPLEDPSDRGIICSILGSKPGAAELTGSVGKGTRLEDRSATPNIYFEGHQIQRFVLEIIPNLIVTTIDKANLSIARAKINEKLIDCSDIDMFFVHQANARIFDIPAKKLRIPKDKFFVNVDRYGNTSSASVLICLAEAVEQGLVGPGSLVMLISFGGGITYGSVLVRL